MSWQGKILLVDLTAGRVRTEPLNMQWAEDYIGARGLATKYIAEMMDPTADALSPENLLIFVTGPLTGTMAPTSGRYAVVTKSPLTGVLACSNSGGKFGAELKNAGYDMLIVTGKSSKPVYLTIFDEEVKILSAGEIWGQTVWTTEAWIKAQHQDPQIKVASIGEAGEQGVRYASVINDLHRAAGRSGVGAVMGAKNLKAIGARGTKGTAIADPEAFMGVVRKTHKILAENQSRKSLTDFGTMASMDSMQAFGCLPTRNYEGVQFDGASKVNSDAMFAVQEDGHRNFVSNKACFGCTIACGRIAHIDKNHFSVVNRKKYWVASGGLEYETAFSFGPMNGIDDINALTFAGYMANEHGFDTVSFGGTLAAAMELYESGVITKEDTEGVELTFGNAEALVIMAEKTGKGEGFGKILGLGSRLMCEKFGHPDVAMHVKGQEFAGFDARALQGMGLGYATSNRGACHLRHAVFSEDMSEISGNGKARPVKESQDRIAAMDSSGLCLFLVDSGMEIEHFAELLDSDLEGNWTVERLIESGERTWNLERLYNMRAGITAADDCLPGRLMNVPAPSGAAKGKVSELDMMLPEYYQERGWTEDGIPTSATLQRLGLEAG
ncbi:aldehyde ferredoxin oxidoreductase family protein [Pseudohalocynthiibacter sp. F2068]|jgi:aldehyde:ferredoxin oxidoreductase|uniref:aldehyde ferredoxin oxidoreductase family protein n=1 Tax=Pseudohalocynthiibacter sp. F2068 TaxID=2926418 RepID=UPI001FF39B47|nr:aldehyde ferredoxin oxidoreductase family protein [Pseudohalocynthiibacter sp. F2068]MCK0104426.1 aldehyde ferredoxin oxidoreductase family protein [Pseudohalocynthiibacter sp. F2068]